jgi:transcriptional regulator with XRE-family HTH domain
LPSTATVGCAAIRQIRIASEVAGPVVLTPNQISEARKELGKALAAWRAVAGLTQAELSSRVNYSRSAIGNVETGRQTAPRAFWERSDQELQADGALVTAYDQFEGVNRRYKEQLAKAHNQQHALTADSRQPPQDHPQDHGRSDVATTGSRASLPGERGVNAVRSTNATPFPTRPDDLVDLPDPRSVWTAPPAQIEQPHREVLERLGVTAYQQRLPDTLIAGVDYMRRSVDRTMASRGTINQGQVDDLDATVHDNARQCVLMPPVEMLRRLILDLADVQDHLVATQRPSVQVGLYRIVAQLATLIADELMVLGDVRQSRAWHGTARFAADQTADAALQADVRTLSALLPLYYGDSSEAVAFARRAQTIAGDTNGLSSALAPTYEALGLAQLGDTSESRAVLAVARRKVESLAQGHRSESIFGFSERRWRFYEGKILSYLGRSEEAWRIHDEALAIGLVRGSRTGAGCELAEQTLLALPHEHRTDIFMRAAGRVLAVVPAEQRSLPEVQSYRETIRACALAR